MKPTKLVLWALFLTGVLLCGLGSYQTVQQSARLVVGSLTSSESDCQGSFVSATSTLTLNANPKKNYSLAYRESLGFFDDVPSEEWEQLRKITLGRVNNVLPHSPLTNRHHAPTWYQTNWDPDFSCRHDTKVGVGDGAKWVCDPHRLARQAKTRMEQYQQEGKNEIQHGCLVYSVGSNGDFRFEEGLQNLLPGVCEIHTFDFTDYSGRVPRGKNIFFHHWGLKPSYKEENTMTMGKLQKDLPRDQPFKTFEETIKELGHEGRPIDLFKIDCEGCEWLTYKDWIGADLRQILVEVHLSPVIAQSFFSDLQKAGYVTFHKEPNIQWGGGECVEYAMLKLSTEYVEDSLAATKESP